jgi:hypothetical protein
MSDDKPRRRLQSQTDRDIASDVARREREAAPVASWDDNYTDRYEAGEIDEGELDRRRSERPPESRMGKLEKKHDALAADVVTIKVDQGKHGVILEALHEDMKARRAAEQADQIDAKKHARERMTKVIGAALAVVSSTAFLTWLVNR